ncbi:MAG: Ig-like domain-containing protein, partial [Nakamurella sp.]
MLAGIAAIAVAWQQPGFPAVPPLSVDDSVWVVNEESSLVGRVNTGIGELDSAAAVRTASNILQDPTGQSAGPVFVVDQTKHELQALDTTTVTFGTRVSIPDNATVQLGGGTLAVTDRVDGRLWVGSAAAVSSVDLRAIAPQTTLGALPVIAISTQGTVVGTAAGSSSLVRLAPGLEPADSTLPAGALSLGDADNAASGADVSDGAADIQLTMVGETPVVLDRADPSLRIGDQRFALPLQEPAGRSVVLQQPGPAATEVLIAAEDGLYAVGLDDGAIRTITNAAGAPVAPVTTGSCSYAAWRPLGGDLTAISSCGKAAGQLVLPEGATGTVRPTFRQHGDAVVLGAADTGKSWVASSNYRLVDNWADVQPPDSAAADQIDQDNPNPNKDDLPAVPPDCSNVPIGTPQAADDAFGVRAGRATVLRVLDNDPSVDCTSVVIDKVSALPPELGSVAIVGDGNSIQLTVPATAAAGSLPAIEYEVSNGRTGTATAQVTVTVEPTSESKPPLPVRRSVASTEVNGTVSYNVLDDYFSPVGDDLYLQSASTDSADLVSFRPDGTITYRNTGTGAGTDSRVNFSITDGSKQANGILIVTLAAEDSSTPVAYPSFISAVVGSTAVAHPLRNVVSAASAPVVIGTVRSEPGSEAATAQLNPIDGSVAIAATAPGDYYFSYEAAAGGRAVTGVLRAQFLEPTDQSRSVVPMTDIAYLPANGETVIDPLANDNDPDGQGLAVREVQIDPNGPIIAAVVDLHLVQLSAPRPPKAPVTVGYSVFDGANTRNGQIRVVPVAAPKQIPPPLAAPIAATVRAGDAVTIPVARFASSQDGSPITAELDEGQLGALPGRAFSTGDTIRYLAAADAPLGQVTFSYTAVAGSSTPLAPVQAVSSVTITVTAADPARNAAPNTPNQITARVFADGIIDISVPLAGTDPDGDWVVLSSIEQPEAPLGTVAVSGADSLTYQAFGVPGVDRIRYLATDPAGLTATGEITVLVAEPGEFARPPVAPDLAIAVRPGASIRVDPLAVVVDPGGQRVRFASPAFTATTGLQVEQDDQGLIVTAPAEETVASLSYEVINTKGLRASGSVRVTVAADAPVPLPAARDVFVKPADLAANNETVDVDVSGSIINRSGRRDQLAVAVDPLSANQAVMTGPTTIRVTVSGTRQIVAYRVTDTFGVGATAFVVVPPRQQLVGPQLIAGMPPISFPAGQSVEVEIGDYVTVGGGRAAEIAASPEPRATQGAAVRTSSTTLTLSAPTSAGGQAAVYVPIDDGAGSAVVLSLPVQIVPRVVPPPKLDSSELSVEAGTSASIDLAALTTTSDLEQAGSLSYGVGPGSGGVQSGQDDSTTTVTVAPDVPRGTVLALPIQVSDGDGRDGKATLTVTVTGSRKPLPTVLDQQIDQGRAGVAVSADLLTGSSDPVGLGLTVGAVSLEEGQVAAGPIVTGSTVALTPAAGFVGSIVVAAEISDGTKDPERVVTARLRVAIQDKPSAPGVPTPVEGTVTAGSVQLTWAPADANGAAIDGYTVIGNGIRQDCAGSASTCTIDGLTAGQPYAFVVTA